MPEYLVILKTASSLVKKEPCHLIPNMLISRLAKFGEDHSKSIGVVSEQTRKLLLSYI